MVLLGSLSTRAVYVREELATRHSARLPVGCLGTERARQRDEELESLSRGRTMPGFKQEF